MNALVTELLSDALAPTDERARVQRRLQELGLHAVYAPERRPPPRPVVIRSLRGSGRAATAALAAERARR